MIVIMQSHATEDQIDSVIEVVEANGCNAHLSVGVERTIIADGLPLPDALTNFEQTCRDRSCG